MLNLVEKFTPEAVEATDDDGVVAIEYVDPPPRRRRRRPRRPRATRLRHAAERTSSTGRRRLTSDPTGGRVDLPPPSLRPMNRSLALPIATTEASSRIELVLVDAVHPALLVCIIAVSASSSDEVAGRRRRPRRRSHSGAQATAGTPTRTDTPPTASPSSSTACVPAAHRPAYQSPVLRRCRRASTTYTVNVPFVGTWTDITSQETTMPCG